MKNKENDPARLFSNRGGALLKELKMKNAVEKGLPKVRNTISFPRSGLFCTSLTILLPPSQI